MYFTNLIKAIIPYQKRVAMRDIWERVENIGFKPYIKKKNVDGVIVDFYIGNTTGRKWYDKNSTILGAEMRFIRDYLIREDDIVFDCGAHHGSTTIFFSKWLENNGKVIAFEPNPENCDIIEKNIEINHLSNVILINKALGEKRGRIKISKNSNSLIMPQGQGYEVDLVCLDDYSYLHPTFLKIDVEGYEIEVLKGAKTILSSIPKLAIEIHTEALNYYGSSIDDLFECFDANQYNLWIQRQDRDAPVPYVLGDLITKRVHLYAIPKG